MSDLFDQNPSPPKVDAALRRPLAVRMRPRVLEDIVGQDHILGPGKLLRRAIEADRLTSSIFYGPPGCGKTTLVEVIARATQRFDRSSGVLSNGRAAAGVEAARMRRVNSGAKPFCPLMKSTASTRRNKMCCCPWRRAPSP